MGRPSLFRTLCAAILLAQLGIGCNRHPAPPALTLMVAASTRDAVKEIAALFTKETGIAVHISAAGSNTLATQIENGAPADVFLSADQKWADALNDKGLTLDMRPLLSNDLVLIVPAANSAGVHSPLDLEKRSVKYVAIAGENVPCGIYTKQAMSPVIYRALETSGKIVRGVDVRGTLNFVERAEAEAGIVYSTDAKIGKNISTVYVFDSHTYGKIVYPLVLLKSSTNPAAAQQLYDFVAGPTARKIFKKYGFRVE